MNVMGILKTMNKGVTISLNGSFFLMVLRIYLVFVIFSFCSAFWVCSFASFLLVSLLNGSNRPLFVMMIDVDDV